jgi:GNAT superfamily N-acetyltransferase
MTATIRLAKPDEVTLIRALEDEAGRLYATAGMPADLPGLDPAVIEAAIAGRTLWVACEADRPIGFALVWIRTDALHLRELDVHPDHMRRGLGRRLVEFVRERAAERGLARVTLTTFRDVDWNASLYRRWGFEVLEPEDQPDWLAAIRAAEDRSVIGQWPRVAMALTATPRTPRTPSSARCAGSP